MPREQGLKPIGNSIKIIIDKIKAEREAKRNKNKPIRTQPKLPGLKKGGPAKYRGMTRAKARKRRRFGPKIGATPSPSQPMRPGPIGRQNQPKAGGPKSSEKKLTDWERKQKYRKEVQDKGGNVIFADEWDKIDPGLKRGIGLKGGGRAKFKVGGAAKRGVSKILRKK